MKFRALDFQHSMEALTIGIGDDSQDRLSIVYRSWEDDAVSSPVFTGSQMAWIRYVTYWPYDKSTTGFLVEIWSSLATGRKYKSILCLCYSAKTSIQRLTGVRTLVSPLRRTSHFPQGFKILSVVLKKKTNVSLRILL